MRGKAIFFAIQIFLLIILELVCLARTWYVKPSGINRDGTSFHRAWSGLNNIIWSKILPGDVLYIYGTFNEKLTVGKSGTSAGLITIRGDLSGFPEIIDVSVDAIKSYVALDGITINRSGANGVSMQQSSNCEVRNCKFYRIGQGSGTVFGIDGRYSQGNYIHNCRR